MILAMCGITFDETFLDILGRTIFPSDFYKWLINITRIPLKNHVTGLRKHIDSTYKIEPIEEAISKKIIDCGLPRSIIGGLET